MKKNMIKPNIYNGLKFIEESNEQPVITAKYYFNF